MTAPYAGSLRTVKSADFLRIGRGFYAESVAATNLSGALVSWPCASVDVARELLRALTKDETVHYREARLGSSRRWTVLSVGRTKAAREAARAVYALEEAQR